MKMFEVQSLKFEAPGAGIFRMLLTAVALIWGSIALSAQPRPALPPIPAAPAVQCRLAGFPCPDAEPGQRIFFTVQEDVFQNDILCVAAGARAKGTIQSIRRTGTTLLLVIEPVTVQTVNGPLVALVSKPVTLELNLSDPEARYCPFSTGLAPVL